MKRSVHDPFIERGMAILDAKVPGWADRVDLKTLDVSSCVDCVVGQLFRNHVNWPSEALGVGYVELGVRRPDLYGFSLNWNLGYRATYGGLTRAWKRAIRARRAAPADQHAEGGER